MNGAQDWNIQPALTCSPSSRESRQKECDEQDYASDEKTRCGFVPEQIRNHGCDEAERKGDENISHLPPKIKIVAICIDESAIHAFSHVNLITFVNAGRGNHDKSEDCESEDGYSQDMVEGVAGSEAVGDHSLKYKVESGKYKVKT